MNRFFELLCSLINLFVNSKTKQQSVILPQADPNDVLVHEAQNWVGTKEVGDNSGPEVERFQKAVNAHPNKEAWCADFVIFCVQQVEQKLGVKSKIYRSERAQDLFFKSPVTMRRMDPAPGNVIIWRHGTSTLGHAGIIEALNVDGTLTTIEGNTGDGSGVVREGDGVYRRTRSRVGSPTMKVVGFIKVF